MPDANDWHYWASAEAERGETAKAFPYYPMGNDAMQETPGWLCCGTFRQDGTTEKRHGQSTRDETGYAPLPKPYTSKPEEEKEHISL